MDEDGLSRRRLLATAGAALGGTLAGCSFGAPSEAAGPDADGESPGASGTPTEFDQLGDDEEPLAGGSAFTEVYRAVVDSVVAVRAQRLGGTSQGTAWVFDDDYLVTNQHVVGEASGASAWFPNDGWREAEVVGTDVYSDLAVLEATDRPADATPLPLVERVPPVGTQVAAIGNPFGLSGSLTTGVISGRGRTIPTDGGFSIADAVQTDAAVNPGNSGGPLVTLDGTVVGVINSGGGDNIGFAISAGMVNRVVPALIHDGDYRHSYMGVSLQDVIPPIVSANDLPFTRGVYIHEVRAGSPSDGVLEGSTDVELVDGQRTPVGGDVILAMDEEPIPSRQALARYLALHTSPGDTIAVDIYRDGSRTTVDLPLGARPEP